MHVWGITEKLVLRAVLYGVFFAPIILYNKVTEFFEILLYIVVELVGK
jgi:hypothetical protein